VISNILTFPYSLRRGPTGIKLPCGQFQGGASLQGSPEGADRGEVVDFDTTFREVPESRGGITAKRSQITLTP